MIGWCSKYVHVVADTFILLGVLKAQHSVRVDEGPTTTGKRVRAGGSLQCRNRSETEWVICVCIGNLRWLRAVSRKERGTSTMSQDYSELSARILRNDM